MKRTATTMFRPTLQNFQQFPFAGGNQGKDNRKKDPNMVPAYHDVRQVPTRRPPTDKVFKTAAKQAQGGFGQDEQCGMEFNKLMTCLSTNDKLSNPAGAKVCADQYATLNTCLRSAGESTAQLGLKSKKFHIDRVYGGLGKKSRIKKGAGKA